MPPRERAGTNDVVADHSVGTLCMLLDLLLWLLLQVGVR